MLALTYTDILRTEGLDIMAVVAYAANPEPRWLEGRYQILRIEIRWHGLQLFDTKILAPWDFMKEKARHYFKHVRQYL